MGMFTNYQEALVKAYQPNNLSVSFPSPLINSSLNPQSASKPYELYNAKDELVGYCWHHGETLNLDFEIEGGITVEPDALIHTAANEDPNRIQLIADVDTRLYNITDLTSWTCLGKIPDDKGVLRYVWKQDPEFTYPETKEGVALKHMYMPTSKYLEDKIAVVTIYNFRMEPVHTWRLPAAKNVRCSIDTELSSKLVKGNYRCSVFIEGNGVNFMVFSPTECELLVK